MLRYFQFLMKIAKEKNSQPLPVIPEGRAGIRLPPERYCLTNSNITIKPKVQEEGRRRDRERECTLYTEYDRHEVIPKIEIMNAKCNLFFIIIVIISSNNFEWNVNYFQGHGPLQTHYNRYNAYNIKVSYILLLNSNPLSRYYKPCFSSLKFHMIATNLGQKRWGVQPHFFPRHTKTCIWGWERVCKKRRKESLYFWDFGKFPFYSMTCRNIYLGMEERIWRERKASIRFSQMVGPWSLFFAY